MTAKIKMLTSLNEDTLKKFRVAVDNDGHILAITIRDEDGRYKVVRMDKAVTKTVESYSEAAETAKSARPIAV